MRKEKLQKHQTLLDVALQFCGGTDAFFSLANYNGFALTDDVAPGTELVLPEIVDYKNQRFFKDSIYKPITGQLATSDILGGIEFWAIETDFIVS